MTESMKTFEIDALTGQIVEREMTNDEIADLEKMQTDAEAQKNELEAKAAARESALAKLAALGLTQEEIEAL